MNIFPQLTLANGGFAGPAPVTQAVPGSLPRQVVARDTGVHSFELIMGDGGVDGLFWVATGHVVCKGEKRQR